MVKRLLFLFFFSPCFVYAQGNTASVKTKVEETNASSFAEKILLEISTELSSDFQKDVDGDESMVSSLALSTGYKLNEGRSVTASIESEKNLNGPEKASISNTKIKWNGKKHETNILGLSYKHGLYTNAPTNESDRRDASFRTALAYEPILLYSLKDRGLPLENSLRLTTKKNFHKYSTNSSAQFNAEYILGLRLISTYEISDTISFSFIGRYSLARTYNEVNKEKFGLEEEIGFSLPNQFSFAIGHRNGGSVQRADGSSNINLYDNIQSEFYTYLTYTL